MNLKDYIFLFDKIDCIHIVGLTIILISRFPEKIISHEDSQ